MELTAKLTITGARIFEGEIDGTHHDVGAIYAETPLTGKGKFGYCSPEYKCADSSVVKSIKHLPFPFNAEVQMTQEFTGKRMDTIIHKVTPIKAGKTTQPNPLTK